MLLRCIAFIVGFVALAGTAQLQAQSFGARTQFNSGISLEFLQVSGATGGQFFNPDPLLYGINGGMNYVLTQSNDIFSLSLDVNVGFSFSYNNFLGSTVLLQFPGYLMAKVGATATKYNESLFGFGLGLGGKPMYVNIPYEGFGFQIYKLKQWLVLPTACAQLSLNTNSSTYTLRGHVSLSPYRGDPPPDNPFGPALDYQNYGIALLINF